MLALLTFVVTTSWLLPVRASAAIPLQVYVAIYAGYGYGSIHTTPLGAFNMEVMFVFENFAFLDAGNADSNAAVDVYVGAILPDGRFTSWVGDPQGSTFVTGQTPVPLFAGIVPVVGTRNVYRQISFTGVAGPGWYVLYGIVVRAGANPLDAREWSGWNPAAFYPLLVTPPITFP
jgi:hypothetical protein